MSWKSFILKPIGARKIILGVYRFYWTSFVRKPGLEPVQILNAHRARATVIESNRPTYNIQYIMRKQCVFQRP